MFSYYGSKSKIVDCYPPPKYGKIIEPFAGSARYSLKYWDRDITIVDKYDVITDVWNYLKNANKSDILSLPKLKKGDDIRTLNLAKEEILLIGFCINNGSVTPKNIVTEWGEKGWNTTRIKIANNVFKVNNWTIKNCSYDELKNENSTWFIDPPYQNGGEHYKESATNIDFVKLGDWCKSRNGQVIVCENTKADWLPFKPVIEFAGAYTTTVEAIWSNHETAFDYVQQSLF